MESVQQFAARIRRKTGAYGDVPDEDLVSRWLKKYPEYADRVETQSSNATHQMHVDRLAKLKADEANAPIRPTTYERAASGLASTVSGIGDIAAGTLSLPENLANIATAPTRVAYTAAGDLLDSHSLPSAFEAAKNVKPMRWMSDYIGDVANDTFQQSRDALGVRPNAITDDQDAALRLAPTAIAALVGAKGMLSHPSAPKLPAETPLAEPVLGEQGAIQGGGPMEPPQIPPSTARITTREAEAAWRALPDQQKAQALEDVRFNDQPKAAPPDEPTPAPREIVGSGPTLAQSGKVSLSSPDDPWGRAIPAILDDQGRAHVAESHHEAATKLGLGSGDHFQIPPERQGWVVDGQFVTLDDLDAYKGDLRAYLSREQTKTAAPQDWLSDFPEVEGVKHGLAEPLSAEESRAVGLGEPTPDPRAQEVAASQQRRTGRGFGSGGEPPPPPTEPVPPAERPFRVAPDPNSIEPPLTVERAREHPIVKAVADLYNRAMPMTTDAIERQGPMGAQVASLMRGSRAVADGRISSMEHALDQVSHGFSADDWDKVGALVEGEKVDGPVDPKVYRAVDMIRHVTGAISDLASKQVKDFVPMEDYLPHLGAKPEDMPPGVQNLVARAGHESYNLTRERTAGSMRPTGSDVPKAIKSYIRGANRYIAELQAFGADSREGLDAKIGQWSRAISANGYDGDILKRYGSAVLGGGAKNDTVSSWLANNVISGESALKTPFAGFRHIHQLAFDTPELGLKNTAKGVVQYIVTKTGMAPELQQMIVDSGILTRNALQELFGNAENSDAVSRGLRGMANVANLPVRIVDTQKAVMTGLAASNRFDEILSVLKGKSVPLAQRAAGDLRATADVVSDAKNQLTRAGITTEMLKTKDGLYQARLQFVHSKVHDIQRGTTLADSPAWSQTPGGRMLYWAQRPAVFGVDFIANRIVKPIAKGNFKPLATYAVTAPVVAWAAEKIPSLFTGEAPAQEKILRKLIDGEDISADDMKRFAMDSYTPHGLIRQGKGAAKTVTKGIENFVTSHTGAYGALYDDARAVGKSIDKKSLTPVLERDMHYHYGKKMTPERLRAILAGQE